MKEIEFIGKCALVKVGKKKILTFGDLHFGYEEVLALSGVFVSMGIFEDTIAHLDLVFEKIGKVDEIVVLGDIKHDFGSILHQEWENVLKFFDYLKDKCKKIIVIKGNHDKLIEPIVRKKDVVLRDYYIKGKYCFLHGDRYLKEIYGKEIKCWIMGHGHPAIKLSNGVKVEKYKCFLDGNYKGKRVIIMPSFAMFSEGSDPRENEVITAWDFNWKKFKAYVIEEDLNVLNFGELGKIR